jgi:hypothetical protein
MFVWTKRTNKVESKVECRKDLMSFDCRLIQLTDTLKRVITLGKVLENLKNKLAKY